MCCDVIGSLQIRLATDVKTEGKRQWKRTPMDTLLNVFYCLQFTNIVKTLVSSTVAQEICLMS